eukprot:701740-Rhodomonas_salina.1
MIEDRKLVHLPRLRPSPPELYGFGFRVRCLGFRFKGLRVEGLGTPALLASLTLSALCATLFQPPPPRDAPA